MSETNPRAVIGSNSGNTSPLLGNEAGIENLVRQLLRDYKTAMADRKLAAEAMREEKQEARAQEEGFFAGLDAARQGALEAMRNKLRTRARYNEAEQQKAEASAAAKAALKRAREAGIEPSAFKVVVRMTEMDTFEAQEYFDTVDLVGKYARLWGSPDL